MPEASKIMREKKKVEGDVDQPSPPSRPSPAPHTHPCWLPFSKVPAESGARLLSCPTLSRPRSSPDHPNTASPSWVTWQLPRAGSRPKIILAIPSASRTSPRPGLQGCLSPDTSSPTPFYRVSFISRISFFFQLQARARSCLC